MRQMAFLSALLSASAIGVTASAAERQTGRLMRGPYTHQDYPACRYGPNGAVVIVNSEDETPAGYVDHPSKVKGYVGAEGTHTAVAPSNGTVSAARAAKTTDATSQTTTAPEVAALTNPVGLSAGNAPDPGATTTAPEATPTDETNKDANPTTVDMDANGHVFDPSLHAATKSTTKAGLWRMKVGVSRPDPAPGYPKPPAPLDL